MVCVVFPLGSSIIYYITDSGLLPSSLSITVRTYLLSSEYVYKLNYFNPTTVKMFIFIIVFNHFRNEVNNFLFNVYVVGFIFITIFSDFAVFASRLASLFSMVELLIIPRIVYSQSLNARHRTFLFFFFFFFFVMIFILNIMKLPNYHWGLVN